MIATQAIKEIMKKQGKSNADLAGRIGVSNNVVYERLTQENISIKNLNQMARGLDYEIVLQPKVKGRRPEGVYLIDGGEIK